MAIGVYVAGEDALIVEAVTLAVERSDELFVAPALVGADVVVADLDVLGKIEPPDPAAVVVLATSNPIAAAREAMERGADGLLAWPQDERNLARLLYSARSRRSPGATGLGSVVEVIGSRGGAGVTTVIAYLARALGRGAMIVDANGGAAGQELFSLEEPATTLTSLGRLAEGLSPDGLRRCLSAHASGVACLYGGDLPASLSEQLVFSCRSVAPVTLVDGPAPDADLSLVVVGADIGSVRAALRLEESFERVEFVFNRVRPKGMSVREVSRTLGRRPLVAIPHDPVVAQKADLGRLLKRGPVVRAARRLGASPVGLEKRAVVRDHRDPVTIA